MDKLLYVSMTGARENMNAQKIHANNLANATTTGFKADLEQARSMKAVGEGLETRYFSMAERPGTDLSQGVLNQTGRDLDIAIDGEGFLAIMDDKGQEVYTRSGELSVNINGELVTKSGNNVLNQNGEVIVLPEASKITVANDGNISVIAMGEQAAEVAIVDRIKFVNPDPKTLFKGLDGNMTNGVVGGVLPADPNVRVQSGYLEASNVSPVTELTSIIGLSRQFEMQVKLMKTAEENSQKATSVMNLG